jgi:peptidyl-dipeptidase Dcp
MLDADAFQAFKETGDIFNRDVAAKFENEILSKGGTRDPVKMYVAFRVKNPNRCLLINRGLQSRI